MQQSFGQAKPIKGLGENKALEASFLSIGYYLSMLRQHFPENCEASEIVTDSLRVLTQINSVLNETSKNAEHLKDLKEKFSHKLNNIKSYLIDQTPAHLEELKDVFQRIDDSLKDKFFPTVNAVAFFMGCARDEYGKPIFTFYGF